MAKTRIRRRDFTSRHRGPAWRPRRSFRARICLQQLNDTDAAFECVAEFEPPTVAIIKHANPVAWRAPLPWRGVGYGVPLRSGLALRGIVAVNRTLDAAAAEKIAAIFTEVIIAPARMTRRGRSSPQTQSSPVADRRDCPIRRPA